MSSPATGAKEVGDVKALLRQAGLRATAARAAVFHCLIEAGGPLSHAEVCERLADAGFDRATVWRNLADLTDAGLVRRTDLGDHLWRFELAAKVTHPVEQAHSHFVCTECGSIACLPAGAVTIHPVRGAPRALRRGEVEVQVRGACNACAEASDSSPPTQQAC
jgi:Fur family ferric uptake transcriptional regulator